MSYKDYDINSVQISGEINFIRQGEHQRYEKSAKMPCVRLTLRCYPSPATRGSRVQVSYVHVIAFNDVANALATLRVDDAVLIMGRITSVPKPDPKSKKPQYEQLIWAIAFKKLAPRELFVTEIDYSQPTEHEPVPLPPEEDFGSDPVY